MWFFLASSRMMKFQHWNLSSRIHNRSEAALDTSFRSVPCRKITEDVRLLEIARHARGDRNPIPRNALLQIALFKLPCCVASRYCASTCRKARNGWMGAIVDQKKALIILMRQSMRASRCWHCEFILTTRLRPTYLAWYCESPPAPACNDPEGNHRVLANLPGGRSPVGRAPVASA